MPFEKNKHLHLSEGLTLVEMLVVLAIVSTFASFFVAHFREARAIARDAKRATEAMSVRKALEFSFIDNDEYPLSSDDVSWTSSCSDAIGWVPDLVAGKYVPMLPVDPVNRPELCYRYMSDGQDFKLAVYMESYQYELNYAQNDGGVFDKWYEKYTPGARDWDWTTKKEKKPKKPKK